MNKIVRLFALFLMSVFYSSCGENRENDGAEQSLNEAILYLKSLDIIKRATAEEFIRRSPKQIDTEFSRKFESGFC